MQPCWLLFRVIRVFRGSALATDEIASAVAPPSIFITTTEYTEYTEKRTLLVVRIWW